MEPPKGVVPAVPHTHSQAHSTQKWKAHVDSERASTFTGFLPLLQRTNSNISTFKFIFPARYCQVLAVVYKFKKKNLNSFILEAVFLSVLALSLTDAFSGCLPF